MHGTPLVTGIVPVPTHLTHLTRLHTFTPIACIFDATKGARVLGVWAQERFVLSSICEALSTVGDKRPHTPNTRAPLVASKMHAIGVKV